MSREGQRQQRTERVLWHSRQRVSTAGFVRCERGVRDLRTVKLTMFGYMYLMRDQARRMFRHTDEIAAAAIVGDMTGGRVR